jgi:MFS family permease
MNQSFNLILIHQSGSRQRFFIQSVKAFDWQALSRALDKTLSPSIWYWRLNQLASSIVISKKQKLENPVNFNSSRETGREVLITTLRSLHESNITFKMKTKASLLDLNIANQERVFAPNISKEFKFIDFRMYLKHKFSAILTHLHNKPLSALNQYIVLTGSYWAFTLTDGALRMLVLFHFFQLGYTTLEIALLFIFYELFGILTNFLGGWLAARFGLRYTLRAGLILQIFALILLIPVSTSWPKLFSVVYVMVAQAISGIAKDLNKMSAKSALKGLISVNSNTSQVKKQLFKWVAILTGSKNALKGIGFFVGSILLTTIGFSGSLALMAVMLLLPLIASISLPQDVGKVATKLSFSSLIPKNKGVQIISLARMFLFGARDVWFVVAIPVFLESTLGWQFWEVGAFMGLWVIGYGLVQALTPKLRQIWGEESSPNRDSVKVWTGSLIIIPAVISACITFKLASPGIIIVVGLIIFGIVFAINSSIHSFLILAYTDKKSVVLNVSFYYTANAAGRLLGTLLSGWVFLQGGIEACLFCSALLVASSFAVSLGLPTLPDASNEIGETRVNPKIAPNDLQTFQIKDSESNSSRLPLFNHTDMSYLPIELGSTALAKRLKSSFQTIIARRRGGELESWSKKLDPDSISWAYFAQSNTYKPI